ncbi:MAG: YncE family protein, partial [Alphaproteobacteria bacterium]
LVDGVNAVPANPPADSVTVIDLKASPPKVSAQLQAGQGAAGVSINRAGTLALVANRSEGTVSVFSIAGNTLTPVGKVNLGDDKAGPSHVAITPDGKTALVTRDGDNKISVLSIDGTKVEHTKRDISAGLRPYGLVVHPNGKVAVAANIGTGSGDADTVSVIDAKNSPFFNDYGLVKVLSLKGNELVPLTEAKVGHWCQGLAWSKGNRTLLVQCMVEKEIMVFSFDGKELKPAGSIKFNAGPAGIRTAEP